MHARSGYKEFRTILARNFVACGLESILWDQACVVAHVSIWLVLVGTLNIQAGVRSLDKVCRRFMLLISRLAASLVYFVSTDQMTV
jgi:hypothetical protein